MTTVSRTIICLKIPFTLTRMVLGFWQGILKEQFLLDSQYKMVRPPRFRNDTKSQGFGQKRPSQYSNNNNYDRKNNRNNNSNSSIVKTLAEAFINAFAQN